MQDFSTITTDNAMEYLSAVASTLTPKHQAMVNTIFCDPAFAVAPGSTKFHHDFLGGLSLHTAEVVRNCLMLASAELYTKENYGDPAPPDFHISYTGTLNLPALLVAAFLHDYCKTLEYAYELELVEASGQEALPDEFARLKVQRIKPGSITRTEYGSRISHVVGSTMIFQMAAMQAGLPLDFVLLVIHVMLAHHGRFEWRSPVEPKTPEAWLLHSADMLSAQP